MSEKSTIEALGENVTNLAYVTEAALLFVMMMAELEQTDALMLRIEAATKDHLPADIVKQRVQWETGAMADISEHLKKCLDIAGDMTNGRDGATEPIIKLHEEAVDGLNMIIDKHIKAG